LSVFIAMSKLYEIHKVLQWLLPLLLVNLALVVLATDLIIHVLWRLRHYNRVIEGFKLQHLRLKNCWREGGGGQNKANEQPVRLFFEDRFYFAAVSL
jgi:hypothetical protein